MVSLEMLYNILIYSLISELLIFAFLNYVLASCFILSEMDDILAHFLTTSLFIFIFKRNIDLNMFI